MWPLLVLLGLLILIAIYDLNQRQHAILRNFPIIGHLRYLLERIGPELRQYIVTSNNEERPFSRDERRWVYTSSKKQNNYFGFGTDHDLELSPNFLILKQAAFPIEGPRQGEAGFDTKYSIPCAKVLGGARQRKSAFRPESVVGISAMSYGSLSAPAIEALNRGAQLSGCLHNTGEGGVSPYHKQGGGLIWQIGTGYFGCRAEDGGFSLDRFLETAAYEHVRAIEIKLSQGAKPGLGGVLPAAKITPEISEIRGIPIGKDCISPSYHRAFHDVDSLLDFVEKLAEASGKPVGIKSAVGQLEFWEQLATAMESRTRGVDFIAVDGGEGGTGAGPLVFTDHVALPFKIGMKRVYAQFAQRGLHHDVVFIGSGKLGFPEQALFGFALGCDMIQVAREAMMAIGCIQAQRCHSGHCPTGVATQNKWLMRGLDPTDKSARLANYFKTLRKEILQLCHAAGVNHPCKIRPRHFEILDDSLGSRSLQEWSDYEKGWAQPAKEDRDAVDQLMLPG